MDNLSPSGYLLTGVISSCVNISVWHPLFTVKTTLMASGKIPKINNLYKGYSANLSCDIANQGVNFYVFGLYSNIVAKNQPLTQMEKFWGGIISGAASSVLLGSLERIMIIQQVQPKNKLSIAHTFKLIIEKESYFGLFRGLTPTIMRESINSSCFFGFSNFIFPKIQRVTEDEKKSSILSYFAAGTLAGGLTTPFDLIKTRMQKDLMSKSSVTQICKDIFKNERKTIFKNLFESALARTALIGCTMATFGVLSEGVSGLLPKCFQKI